jgi:hypothetical protein
MNNRKLTRKVAVVTGASKGIGVETEMKTQQQSLTHRWRAVFRRRRRMHDPMLVLNMSIFNFADGWNRTFNPLRGHENGT